MFTHSQNLIVALTFAIFLPSQCLSSSEPPAPVLSVSPESYLETNGDKMTSKELMDYALANQPQKQAVVQYFQHRFNKLKNTQCPTLSAAWLRENSGREFPVGSPSLFEPNRLPPVLSESRITSIDNITWSIKTTYFITHTAKTRQQFTWIVGNPTFDVTHNPNVTDLNAYRTSASLMKQIPLANIGLIAQKICEYDLDQNPNEQDPKKRYRYIALTIYDEFPKLDGIDFSVK